MGHNPGPLGRNRMRLTNVCTTSSTAYTTCTVCTGQDAITPRPARVVEVPNPGWNAGANSIAVRDGDLVAQWTVPEAAGAVCGFAHAPRADATDVTAITHGWYAFAAMGFRFAQPYEAGHPRAPAEAIDATSELELRRIAGVVTYWLDGVEIYESMDPSAGPTVLAASLYSPEDSLADELFTGVGDLGEMNGAATIRYIANGSDVTSIGIGRLGYTATGNDYGAVPVAPAVSVGVGNIGWLAAGELTALGYGSGSLSWSAFGVDVDSYGSGKLRYKATGDDRGALDGITLMQAQGYLAIVADAPSHIAVFDSVVMGDAVTAQAMWFLMATAEMRGEVETVLEGLNALASAASMLARHDIIYRMLLSAGITMESTAEERLTAGIALIEQVLLVAEPGNTLSATEAVVGALAAFDAIYRVYAEQLAANAAMGDQLNRGEHASVTASASFNTVLAESVTRIEKLLAEALLTSVPELSMVFTAALTENIQMGTTLSSVLEALIQVSDGVLMTATFQVGNGLYTAWVCHTSIRAFTQYENYPFNSFCELDGKYYGMAPDGIYELTGDTDDGEPITWRIRTALDNMGTGRMKRVPAMYLGYTSDGTVMLKAITTSDSGEKEEAWYRLREQTAQVSREGRIKLGRGLKSVYWQFELEGTGSVALDEMQLFPLILDRRL